MPGPTNNHAARNLPAFPLGTFGQGACVVVEIAGVGSRIITDAAIIISGTGEGRP